MRRLAQAGLFLLALGAAAMALPGLFAVRLDEVLVTLVGFVALVLAYRAAVTRRHAGVRRAETGDPEVLAARPVPGADLHDAIANLIGGRSFYHRNGLREAAVAVLTRYEGATGDEARERVEAGDWTTDPVAAAHLGRKAPPAPIRAQLGRLRRGESAYAFGRRRAIEAIAAVAGVALDESAGSGLPTRFGTGGVDRFTVDDEPTDRRTGHWGGVSLVALVAVGLGVAADVAPVVLAGVVGVGFAAYARGASPPLPELSIERELADPRPDDGEPVPVTLTVRNDGKASLPDLRLVDGVPGALTVVEGSPRLGTALRPGESATLSYEVEARRGEFTFDPVTVLARNLAGTTAATRRIPVETTLRCVTPPRPLASPVPIRAAATQYAGRVRTETGGDGVEFHATRAYQPGDPTNRIDWNRRARTGKLATLEFREEQAATVVVVVDVRPSCYVAHAAHQPHAVDRSVDAAARLAETLLSAGNRVGLGALGADAWLAPGSGEPHRTRLRTHLRSDPAFSSSPPADSAPRGWSRRLRRRLPAAAQLLVCSPLVDGRAVRLVRTLDAAGHPAAVLSPDPTVGSPEGPLLARTGRRLRITDLRRAGIPVVDWSPDSTLEAALARTAERRSA